MRQRQVSLEAEGPASLVCAAEKRQKALSLARKA